MGLCASSASGFYEETVRMKLNTATAHLAP